MELVAQAGWPSPRLARLRDVEWVVARRLSWPEAIFGACGARGIEILTPPSADKEFLLGDVPLGTA